MRRRFSFRGTMGFVLAAALLAGAASRVAAQPALQFSRTNYPVSESASAATITVVRLGSVTEAVTADFYTADGLAMADQDYVQTNGTLSFGPGVTSRSFTVPMIRDAMHESSKTVTLQLVNPSPNAKLGRDQATLTILDDDFCTYSLAPTGATLGPEGGSGTFMVNATPGCQWTVTVLASSNWVGAVASGTIGTNQVSYSVDPNPLTAARTATLRVAGGNIIRNFVITQRGVPPPDVTRPVVTFATPFAGARITNLPMTVAGRAGDARGVAFVQFRVENSAGTNNWAAADNTTNWTASADGLLPGLNTIRVRAHDPSGNMGEAARAVNFVVVSPLDLDIDGNGGVTGARDGQFLDVGKTYTVTATASPARVNLFAEWAGDLSTNSPRVTFRMATNLHLVAKFVPNPFIAARGAYNGLFENAPPVRHESSGFFTATTTDLGAFSARVTLAGRVIPFTGRFALDGRATNTILRTDPSPVTVLLQLHFGEEADQISGTLGNGNWSASLHADRATFHPATNSPAEKGRYTFLLAGDSDSARGPHGFSAGSVNVDTAGRIILSATLAEGSILTQVVPLAKDRRWPLYGRLYGGAGSILGWLQFADGASDDFNGSVTWNKPPLAGSRFYTNSGFTLTTNASGARYSAPTNALDFLLAYTNALVGFSGGNVEPWFENAVQINPGNRVVNLPANPNKLTFTIITGNGLFNGVVTVPGTTRSLPFKGALNLKGGNGGYGAGFFPGTNESGRVELQAGP